VVPGAGDGDRAQDRVDDLVPVRHELRLVPRTAVNAGAAVSRVSGQQPFQQPAAQFQHAGADRRLGRFQPRIRAGRPDRGRGQPPYLGGRLRRERVREPP